MQHRTLKRPRIIWLILLMASVCVCWWPAPQATLTAKIKVENDGAIMSGMSGAPATGTYGYDPYFIPVNDVAHVSISIAKKAVETK